MTLPADSTVFFQLLVPAPLLGADGEPKMQPVAQGATMRQILQGVQMLGLQGKPHCIIACTVVMTTPDPAAPMAGVNVGHVVGLGDLNGKDPAKG